MSEAHERERGPLAALTQIVSRHGRAWLVGGAVRDALLGRPTPDFDLAVEGDVAALAREFGRRAGGHAFQLSEAFGAWRVRSHEQDWQVDLTPLMGETLDQDLRRRDLTINAIARELSSGSALIDPCGGVADLEARRLRSVGPHSFTDDPLRVLRLARMAAELGFTPEPETLRLAAESAPRLSGVAAERVFAELRLTLVSDGAVGGLELAGGIGATAAVLPELEALRGLVQSDYHHLDVYEHTLATLQASIDLVNDPSSSFGDALAPALQEFLSEPLANELTRGQALRFGALLHDIAKPLTYAVSEEGRPTFFQHDLRGAELTTKILARLRASDRLNTHVTALARHHLRLGFLVHERPLSRRATYHYLATCEPVEVDVTVLSVADRLATRGRNADRAVALHLDLAREMLVEALAWRRERPRPPIAGDELARAVGIGPGPQLGRLLAELAEAAYAGEIGSDEELLAHARDWVAQDSATSAPGTRLDQ